MKKILLFCIASLIAGQPLIGQNVQLAVDGSVVLGNSDEPMPTPGTIRWSGTDFEAFNGLKWVTLTGGKTAPATDVDGNKYPSQRIGDQIWMTESLRTTKYRDGTLIPSLTDDNQWQNTTGGAYCWFENNNIYDQPHGKLYNWHALTDSRGLCPEGWRAPTRADYMELIAFLGDASIAGGKMKQEGTATWVSPNEGASNSSGFTAVGYGYRQSGGDFSALFPIGTNTRFWSATALGNDPYYYSLYSTHTSLLEGNLFGKNQGMSVRCIK